MINFLVVLVGVMFLILTTLFVGTVFKNLEESNKVGAGLEQCSEYVWVKDCSKLNE